MELQKMFIDGSWVEGSGGKSAPTYNPANGEILAMMTEGTEEDVKKAVAAAKKSFYETREWRDMDVQVRSDMILKIADAIEAEKDVFAKLDCLDLGKPLREAEADVDDAIHCFRYYAGAMKTPCGGYYEVNEGFGKMHTYTIHEPVGVCGLITPWNYPLLMGVWKLAPALAAGNSVVFKPSSNCVLSSVHLFEIFEKVGLPKGCANLVLGPGLCGGQYPGRERGCGYDYLYRKHRGGTEHHAGGSRKYQEDRSGAGRKIPQRDLRGRGSGRRCGVGHDRHFPESGRGLRGGFSDHHREEHQGPFPGEADQKDEGHDHRRSHEKSRYRSSGHGRAYEKGVGLH